MMKRIGLKVFALLIFQLGLSASEAISCERIDQQDWSLVGSVKTCEMKSTTMISSEGVSISPVDSSVLALSFGYNKEISFLPIRLDETFPNLAVYYASHCSLKTVSKLNFRNLKKLRILWLSGNEIERIDSDTFEDLTSLEWLILADNKIKRMNGAVFAGLSKLTKINLSGNICINRGFGDAAAIASLIRDVSENCGGFADLETIWSQQNEQRIRIESLTEKVLKENKELSIEVASLKAQLAASLSSAAVVRQQLATSEDLKQQTVRDLSNEVTRITAESSAAKASLASAADVRQQLENQIWMMTTLDSKLENSWELTCKERTKDLTENVQRKGEEIDGLLEEQIKLRSEVNEKKTKLEYLQAKLDDLNC